MNDLAITYPVMIDGDFSYWRAMNNRYWPAFYLVDRHGKIALAAFGELHRATGAAMRWKRRSANAWRDSCALCLPSKSRLLV